MKTAKTLLNKLLPFSKLAPNEGQTTSQEKKTNDSIMIQTLSEKQSSHDYNKKEKIDFLKKEPFFYFLQREQFPSLFDYLEQNGIFEIRDILEQLSKNECLFLFQQLGDCLTKKQDFCIKKWFNHEYQYPYRSFFLDCQRQDISCHRVDFIQCYYQLFHDQQDKMIENYPLLFIECMLKKSDSYKIEQIEWLKKLLSQKMFKVLSEKIVVKENAKGINLNLLIDCLSHFTSAEGYFLFLKLLNVDVNIDHNIILELILSQKSSRVQETLFLFNHFPQEIYYYIIFSWKIKTYSTEKFLADQKNIFKNIYNELFFDTQENKLFTYLSNMTDRNNNNDLAILANHTQNVILNLIIEKRENSLKLQAVAMSLLNINEKHHISRGLCHGLTISHMYACLDSHYKNENIGNALMNRCAYFYKALQFDIPLQAIYDFSSSYLQQSIMLRFSRDEVIELDNQFYQKHSSLYKQNHIGYVDAFRKAHLDVTKWIDFFYSLEEIVLLQGLQGCNNDSIKFNQTDSFYYKGDKNSNQKKYPYKETLQLLNPYSQLAPYIHHFALGNTFELIVKNVQDILNNPQLLQYIQGMGNECIDYNLYTNSTFTYNNQKISIMLSHAILLIKNDDNFYVLDDLTCQRFQTAEEVIQSLCIPVNKVDLKARSMLNIKNDNPIGIEYRLYLKQKMNFEPNKNQLPLKSIMKKMNQKEYSSYRQRLFLSEKKDIEALKDIIIDYRKELYDFDSITDEDIFYLVFNIDNQFSLTALGEVVLDNDISSIELKKKILSYYRQNKLSYSSLDACYKDILDKRNKLFVHEKTSGRATNLTFFGLRIKLHDVLPICDIPSMFIK